MRRLAVLLLTLVVPACGLFTTVSAGDYPRDCVEDGGCAAMFEGEVCVPCACANAAVSARAEVVSEVGRDFSAARAWCGAMPEIACGPCPEPRVACRSGACVLDARP